MDLEQREGRINRFDGLSNPEDRYWRGFAGTWSLGPMNDSAYVDREIEKLWAKALTSEAGSFGKNFRLALIRSLLQSDL